MIKYPETLPLPLRQGYAFEPVNRIRRTEMDVGRAMQRLEFEDAPTMVSVNWLFDEGQARLFEAWSEQVAGAGWFEMKLRSPMGLEDLEVRFPETPKGGELVGVNHWRYAATIEIRFRPLLVGGWVEILPEYLLLADIFDLALHEQWPNDPYQNHMNTFDIAVNEKWPAA